jgi:hypothetical protein
MCADIRAEVARLEAKGVELAMPIRDQGWGLLTNIKLPDGEALGLYQPKHPMAIGMKLTRRSADKKTPAKKKRNAGGPKSARS